MKTAAWIILGLIAIWYLPLIWVVIGILLIIIFGNGKD
jgi:uncharacterized membrane protein